MRIAVIRGQLPPSEHAARQPPDVSSDLPSTSSKSLKAPDQSSALSLLADRWADIADRAIAEVDLVRQDNANDHLFGCSLKAIENFPIRSARQISHCSRVAIFVIALPTW
jgi:hypothetical protein